MDQGEMSMGLGEKMPGKRRKVAGNWEKRPWNQEGGNSSHRSYRDCTVSNKE